MKKHEPAPVLPSKRREALAKRGDVSDVTRFQHVMKHLFFKADFALKRSVDWMKLAAEKHRSCHEIACQCIRKLGQLFLRETVKDFRGR